MKLKKGFTVRINFANGTNVIGVVSKASKEEIILKSKSDTLIIPNSNHIIMIHIMKEFKREPARIQESIPSNQVERSFAATPITPNEEVNSKPMEFEDVELPTDLANRVAKLASLRSATTKNEFDSISSMLKSAATEEFMVK